MQSPIVVNISKLHRQTSEVVCQAENADRPVFVTQFACVVAVLLPRSMYDRLLRAAEAGQQGAEQADAQGGAAAGGFSGTPRSPLESPLAVFGPLPRGTRFMTRRGLSIDAEMAAWLMEDGEEVRPILEKWRDPLDLEGDEGGDSSEGDEGGEASEGGEEGEASEGGEKGGASEGGEAGGDDGGDEGGRWSW